MRIIAGQWRSRRLVMPKSLDTRPMPDRVKEAVFAMLGAHFDCPGRLPPIRIADVFAGSGSMGLEALSRGAAECWFFERGRDALAALQHNLDSLQVGANGTIVTCDAWNNAVLAPDGKPFDMVLLDPPYVDTQDMSETSLLATYLNRIAESQDNRPVVVLHHKKRSDAQAEGSAAWRVIDRRTFGTNAITLFLR